MIFDVNEPGRTAGDFLRFGRDNRDDVAVEAHLVVADDGMIVQIAHAIAGHILAGIDLDASWQLHRLGRINCQNPGVSLVGQNGAA